MSKSKHSFIGKFPKDRQKQSRQGNFRGRVQVKITRQRSIDIDTDALGKCIINQSYKITF